jgi:hypothetical protein
MLVPEDLHLIDVKTEGSDAGTSGLGSNPRGNTTAIIVDDLLVRKMNHNVSNGEEEAENQCRVN